MTTIKNLAIGLLLLTFAACNSGQKLEEIHETAAKQVYEWRTYQVDSMAQKEALVEFLENVVVPAYRNAGIPLVGAFTNADSMKHDVYLLLPFQSIETFLQVSAKASMEIYESRHPANLANEAKGAHFGRINSQLLTAFELAPELKKPQMGKQKGRIFEFRSYESISERKGREKVAMFNEGGEIDIFENLGFQPVFFAEAIVGDQRPNLIYMTTHESWESVQEKWDAFVADSVWVAIKGMDRYANTVSKIHKEFLIPLSISDI